MIKIINDEKNNETAIFNRNSQLDNSVEDIVKGIIENVKTNGDTALKEYCKKFDKVELDSFIVTDEEIESAYKRADKFFIQTLLLAKENIKNFHRRQLREGFSFTQSDGAVLGQKITPLEKVGIYVPGGTASYPSTVLMNALPAKIANVDEIIMVTPPQADGNIKDDVLVAAKIAGVDKIYKIGGAQAIAALAYGTESIPKVDKITGPGNIFVATAKRLVYGIVDIDMIAGPSEILVIADGSANEKYVAADLLSQAEHDKLASAVLITDNSQLAFGVQKQLEEQLKALSREDIARTSIESNGKIIITDSINRAIQISNKLAPEHLEICIKNPFDALDKVKNAGSIFLGNNTPEALGDYIAGPNHTLPTSGTARYASPLSVDDFVKKSSYIYYTDSALEKVSDNIIDFASREGLTAHANSVAIRGKKIN
jgi:histidinol dehydrogenase